MVAIEVGRVIVKTAGRESLMKAVIVDLIDQNFALISGAGVSPDTDLATAASQLPGLKTW